MYLYYDLYGANSVGQWFGSVGRVVASNNLVPWFEASHMQILLTTNCIAKTKIKKKRPGIVQF